MTGDGQGGPTTSAAEAAAIVAAASLAATAALAWSMFLGFAVAILTLTRGFLFYPLALVSIGGMTSAGVFAWGSQWRDAGSALFVALAASALLAAYGFIALKLNPRFFERDRFPWWWTQ